VEPLRVNSHLVLPPSELVVTSARSGGPGGQNVNKVASKIVLRFDLTTSAVLGERRKSLLFSRLASRLTSRGELVIHASSYRDRARNLEDAYERLAGILRDALQVDKKRVATRPTRASKRRRLDAKRRRGEIKRDRRPDQRND
jgi:ribosome-associated protein